MLNIDYRTKCLSNNIIFIFIAINLFYHQYSFAQFPANQDQLPLPPQEIISDGLKQEEDKNKEFQKTIEPVIDLLKPEEKEELSTELPLETPCFEIKKIIFTGIDADVFSWLERKTKPFLNKCIGVEGLQKVLNFLNAELIDDGFVTSRITLPEQNLSSGILILNVHVGRIAEIRMIQKEDTERKKDENWGTWINAFPIKEGDVLNIRDLEQGVEQMKRIPSQKVTTKIEPGPFADTSIVFIEREEIEFFKRLRFGITLDNSGSSVMGRSQLSTFLAFDNPTGLNDVLSISGITNLENLSYDHTSQSFTLNYSIPYTFSTFHLSNSYSQYAQNVTLTTARLLSKGNSNKTDAKWNYTAIRTSSAKFGVYSSISARQSNSYINDTELIIHRRRTTNLQVGITYKKLIHKISLDLNLGYRWGVSWLNAQADFDKSKDDGLTLRPHIWLLEGNYNQFFSLWNYPLQFSSFSRLQYTKDKVTTVDQFSIGNRYNVRGFEGDNILISDGGYSIKNDLMLPIKIFPNIMSLMSYLGIDYGRVWGPNSSNLVGYDLSGAVAGLQGKIYNIQFDLAISTPVYKPKDFKTAKWNPYLSVSSHF